MQLHKKIKSTSEWALLALLAVQPAPRPPPTQDSHVSRQKSCNSHSEISLVPPVPYSFCEILQSSKVMRVQFCFKGHSEWCWILLWALFFSFFSHHYHLTSPPWRCVSTSSCSSYVENSCRFTSYCYFISITLQTEELWRAAAGS